MPGEMVASVEARRPNWAVLSLHHSDRWCRFCYKSVYYLSIQVLAEGMAGRNSSREKIKVLVGAYMVVYGLKGERYLCG